MSLPSARLFKPLVLALGSIATSQVFAACTTVEGFKTKVVNVSMSPTTVSDRNLPVGAVLKSEEFSIQVKPGNEKLATCKGGGNSYGRVHKGSELTGFPGVFDTAIPGVGIRFTRIMSSGLELVFPHDTPQKWNNIALYVGTRMRAELVKTAPVTGSGTLDAGMYTTERFDSGVNVIETYVLAGAVTVFSPACTVPGSQSIKSVSLGPVKQSDFKGVATVAGVRGFDIRLNCNAVGSTLGSVDLRFDGARHPSGLPGVLQLTQQEGVAKGVGIQVIDEHGMPVDLGAPIPVTPSVTGEYVVPLKAAYIQTSAVITSGVANGSATFTVTHK